MIDDIIEFVDNEDEEGVIIFVDQQKAFDRMEWGWLNYVMECFNSDGQQFDQYQQNEQSLLTSSH
jgi:hypothetical protein